MPDFFAGIMRLMFAFLVWFWITLIFGALRLLLYLAVGGFHLLRRCAASTAYVVQYDTPVWKAVLGGILLIGVFWGITSWSMGWLIGFVILAAIVALGVGHIRYLMMGGAEAEPEVEEV